MMRHSRQARVAGGVLLLGAGLSGCVSLKRTPEARFFALRPVAEAPSPGGATPFPSYGLVGVLPVLLPGHLERPQIVAWTGPGELRIDEFLRWAEPLATGVPRVLAENLDLLLPDRRVVRAPWPGRTPLRCRVRVEIRRFGAQPEGEVVLSGRWALLPATGERPYVVRSAELRRDLSAGTGPALDPGSGVESMSELLGDLSREIAAAIAALPPEAPDAPAAPPS